MNFFPFTSRPHTHPQPPPPPLHPQQGGFGPQQESRPSRYGFPNSSPNPGRSRQPHGSADWHRECDTRWNYWYMDDGRCPCSHSMNGDASYGGIRHSFGGRGYNNDERGGRSRGPCPFHNAAQTPSPPPWTGMGMGGYNDSRGYNYPSYFALFSNYSEDFDPGSEFGGGGGGRDWDEEVFCYSYTGPDDSSCNRPRRRSRRGGRRGSRTNNNNSNSHNRHNDNDHDSHNNNNSNNTNSNNSNSNNHNHNTTTTNNHNTNTHHHHENPSPPLDFPSFSPILATLTTTSIIESPTFPSTTDEGGYRYGYGYGYFPPHSSDDGSPFTNQHWHWRRRRRGDASQHRNSSPPAHANHADSTTPRSSASPSRCETIPSSPSSAS